MNKSIDMISNIATEFGNGSGDITAVLSQTRKDTADMILHTVFPFMIFASTLVGITSTSGVENIIARFLTLLADILPGLLVLSFIRGMPFLSLALGPGAVIAQVVGVLIDTEIRSGSISPQLSLPALFAINSQIAANFLPVALSLVDADPETIEVGVPSILMTRVVTDPLGVFIGYLLSVGLHQRDCSV